LLLAAYSITRPARVGGMTALARSNSLAQRMGWRLGFVSNLLFA
jgi:hypothetical protein